MIMKNIFVSILAEHCFRKNVVLYEIYRDIDISCILKVQKVIFGPVTFVLFLKNNTKILMDNLISRAI